ncbi:hypothetical protein SAMN04488691_101425 [Haloferax larsenii]|uniref:Uncharacterized protein n=2 Tax=Haloferax larsenii TaxID=302484 RepID=A0A1H7GX27_HALLR|nr:hypothetical protein SAMN04488691_101425 [Haloferax larsenii]
MNERIETDSDERVEHGDCDGSFNLNPARHSNRYERDMAGHDEHPDRAGGEVNW